jgi:hypothetical protein
MVNWKEIDPETLKEFYWEKELSLREVSALMKMPQSTILTQMKNCHIPRRSVSDAKKLQWARPIFKEKMQVHLRKIQALSHKKKAIAKGRRTKLGATIAMPTKKIPHLHDLLISYTMLNPQEFGYEQVWLIQTSDFDLIGVKPDGMFEKIEVEECGKDFLSHSHNPAICDRIITYYKPREKIALPVISVNKKEFLTFADKIYKILNRVKIW